MLEYVYALHDFAPEHEDEIHFRAGERIEVVERDDLYGDGWWQGRNLSGKVGLFPQSYTAPAPPADDNNDIAPSSSTSSNATETHTTTTATTTSQPLQSLHEEESDSESPQNDNNILIAPIPQAPTTTTPFLNGHESQDPESQFTDTHQRTTSSGEEVMKATMTDVQKAIEQLGQKNSSPNNPDGEGDEAASFSFASSRGGETDTDFDMSDADGVDNVTGEGWHKGARTKLAAKARKAVEEAEKLEAMLESDSRRAFDPPIEVELSDESEGEEDFTAHTNIFTRTHPYILEEDEEETDPERVADSALMGRNHFQHHHQKHVSSDHNTLKRAPSSGGASSTRALDDDLDLEEAQTATAPTFPVIVPQRPGSLDSASSQLPPQESSRSRSVEQPTSEHQEHRDSGTSPPPAVVHTSASGATESKSSSSSHNTPYRESLIALPSPTGSFPAPTISTGGGGKSLSFGSGEQHSKHSSITSMSRMSQPPLTASSLQTTLVEQQQQQQAGKKKSDPSEWSVDEVVEWLRSKGFDQEVCDKFTEQEITGDVLLELDVNLLKTEIGVMAFGKRMRIANAITDLRRPPSIIYSDHQPDNRSPSHPPLSPSHSQGHSRHQSLSHSHHSFPGSNIGVVGPGVAGIGSGFGGGIPYTQTVQISSASSPGMGTGSVSPGMIMSPPPRSNGTTYTTTSWVESPNMEYAYSQSSPVFSDGYGSGQHGFGMSSPAIPGVNGRGGKGRPALLTLSPSDSALKESVKAVSDVAEEEGEDRGFLSESEAAPTSNMRRRLFGRSFESSGSAAQHSRNSKDGSILTSSPIIPDRDKGKDKSKDKDKDKDKDSSRRARSRRSAESGGNGGSKSGDRLSIFGSTFSGTLGKSRKPPPKYPAGANEEITNGEKHSSMFALPRITSGASRKSSSGTPNGTPKHSFKEPKSKSSTPVIVAKDTRDHAILRKRTSSAPVPPAPVPAPALSSSSDVLPKDGTDVNPATNGENRISNPIKQGQSILEQIGEADHVGWMRKKGDRYNSWKLRYFVLKGHHLYCLRSNSNAETKIKGYVNIIGYKVTVDENVNPGRYGFRIDHDNDKTHYFSSDDKVVIRDWMKAIMKATIGRDYMKPVISSCNIPTIPLTVAQAMNPAPRPPSPTARDATQRALRRENPNQLSSRDARILMGLPSLEDTKEERARLDSFFSRETVSSDAQEPTQSPTVKPSAPVRPSRELRRWSSTRGSVSNSAEDNSLIEWANSHLPSTLQITDPNGPLCGGLALLRLAESIRGRPLSPPVSDSAFPQGPTDDKLDGLFKLFDFLLDNDVKMGSVSINDIRQGKRDKILQLLRALKAWEDKRRAIAHSLGSASTVQSGGYIAPVSMVW